MICRRCGCENNSVCKFCIRCGASLDNGDIADETYNTVCERENQKESYAVAALRRHSSSPLFLTALIFLTVSLILFITYTALSYQTPSLYSLPGFTVTVDIWAYLVFPCLMCALALICLWVIFGTSKSKNRKPSFGAFSFLHAFSIADLVIYGILTVLAIIGAVCLPIFFLDAIEEGFMRAYSAYSMFIPSDVLYYLPLVEGYIIAIWAVLACFIVSDLVFAAIMAFQRVATFSSFKRTLKTGYPDARVSVLFAVFSFIFAAVILILGGIMTVDCIKSFISVGAEFSNVSQLIIALSLDFGSLGIIFIFSCLLSYRKEIKYMVYPSFVCMPEEVRANADVKPVSSMPDAKDEKSEDTVSAPDISESGVIEIKRDTENQN